MDDNPWLTSQTSESSAEPEVREPEPRRWAPGAVVEPVDGLPVAAVPGGGLWVLGAHGGAGASTLAGLLGARDALGAWPLPTGGESRVLVVARTSGYGVARAQCAALQWASGTLPGIELVGVVWVADAPGRTPRELRRHLALVSGAFPRAVNLPWVNAWRVEHPISTPPPKPFQASLKQLLET